MKTVTQQRTRMMCPWILAAALLVAGGCQPIGSRQVKPEYIPVQIPMLVLVESQGTAEDVGLDADNVSAAVWQGLNQGKIAPMVDPRTLQKLHDANPKAYDAMTIVDIGRACGAQQVLYINLTDESFDQPIGGEEIRGLMTAKVRIVNVADGTTLWPSDAAAGKIVKVNTPWQRISTAGVQAKLHRDMADSMAISIGRLFVEWTSTAPEAPEDKPQVE